MGSMARNFTGRLWNNFFISAPIWLKFSQYFRLKIRVQLWKYGQIRSTNKQTPSENDMDKKLWRLEYQDANRNTFLISAPIWLNFHSILVKKLEFNCENMVKFGPQINERQAKMTWTKNYDGQNAAMLPSFSLVLQVNRLACLFSSIFSSTLLVLTNVQDFPCACTAVAYLGQFHWIISRKC